MNCFIPEIHARSCLFTIDEIDVLLKDNDSRYIKEPDNYFFDAIATENDFSKKRNNIYVLNTDLESIKNNLNSIYNYLLEPKFDNVRRFVDEYIKSHAERVVRYKTICDFDCYVDISGKYINVRRNYRWFNHDVNFNICEIELGKIFEDGMIERALTIFNDINEYGYRTLSEAIYDMYYNADMSIDEILEITLFREIDFKRWMFSISWPIKNIELIDNEYYEFIRYRFITETLFIKRNVIPFFFKYKKIFGLNYDYIKEVLFNHIHINRDFDHISNVIKNFLKNMEIKD